MEEVGGQPQTSVGGRGQARGGACGRGEQLQKVRGVANDVGGERDGSACCQRLVDREGETCTPKALCLGVGGDADGNVGRRRLWPKLEKGEKLYLHVGLLILKFLARRQTCPRFFDRNGRWAANGVLLPKLWHRAEQLSVTRRAVLAAAIQTLTGPVPVLRSL